MSYRVRVYGQALLGWHDEDTLDEAIQSAKSLLKNNLCDLAEVIDNDTRKDVWSSSQPLADDRWARLREQIVAYRNAPITDIVRDDLEMRLLNEEDKTLVLVLRWMAEIEEATNGA